MPPFDVKSATDADLMTCFVAGRDQRAFAEIVQRHGPMVMGVARRLLRHEQDAADAFQATFLALAVAAGRRRWRPTIAAWLHQTAVRCANSIRRTNARWQRRIDRRKEVVAELYSTEPPDDLVEILDDELRRLPTAYRAAVVLCDLEGLSANDAARRLGIPAATVKTHVARGRKLLAGRLTSRGITVSVGALVASFAKLSNAGIGVTPELIEHTTSKAMRFAAGHAPEEVGVSTSIIHAAQEVLRTMSLTKSSLILVAALVAVLVPGWTGGVWEFGLRGRKRKRTFWTTSMTGMPATGYR